MPRPRGAGCWPRRSSARAWRSSTARSSTSRCRRCSATCTRRPPTCSGWSRPTRCCWPRCCWSAARSATASGGGASSRVGVALFALASVGCALAPDVRQLIAARAVQGIGAALLVPGSLALISASFPERSAAGRSAPGPASAPSPRPSGRCWAAGWSTTLVALGLPHQRAAGGRRCCHRYSGACPKAATSAARRALDVRALAGDAGLGGIVYALIEAPRAAGAAARCSRALASASSRRGASSWSRRARASRCCRCALPLPQLRRREPADAVALRGARRRPVLLSAQPDPGAGLLRDRGRRGAAAVHRDHVRAVALGRAGWSTASGRGCRWSSAR